MVVTGNGGVGTDGIYREQAIRGSGGQYEGGAVDEASEGGSWKVGGNCSNDLFEEPVMRRRSTWQERHEEKRSYGLVRTKNLSRASQNTPTDGLLVTLLELHQLQELDESKGH